MQRTQPGSPNSSVPVWLVVVVSAAVLIVPAGLSWAVASGALAARSWPGIAVACVVSLVICQGAGMLWERGPRSADVLFSDLLAWGWLRRRAIERRIADAGALFSPGAERPVRRSPVLRRPVRRDAPQPRLRRLAADLEATDPYTHGHSRRVARYAVLIGRRMGLTRAQVRQLRLAAALHDIGKLHTPREILTKPGRLTDEEFEIVRRHPGDGARMIAALIEDEDLTAIVRHHHERLDGTGYPDRLAAEKIPLGARIIAVADTFDAITSRRSYREAKPHKVALDVMRAEAGTQLDPEVVRAFRSTYFGRRWLWLQTGALSSAGRLLQTLLARFTPGAVTVSSAALAAGAIGVPVIVGSPGHAAAPSTAAVLAGRAFPHATTARAVRIAADAAVVTARRSAGVRERGRAQRGSGRSTPTFTSAPVRRPIIRSAGSGATGGATPPTPAPPASPTPVSVGTTSSGAGTTVTVSAPANTGVTVGLGSHPTASVTTPVGSVSVPSPVGTVRVPTPTGAVRPPSPAGPLPTATLPSVPPA